MIEFAVAAAAVVIALGVMWWRDARGHSGWDDLFDPGMPELQDQIARKFSAEERAARSFGERFVAGLVPGRVQIVGRFAVYARILAAAAPLPGRVRERVARLRATFPALTDQPSGSDALAKLDAEALDACRALTAAAERVERGGVK